MILVEPEYYAQFHCAAGACPDTCCAAWEVEIDPNTLHFYRRAPGQYGQRLRRAISCDAGVWRFRTQNGRCPMLTDDGLCSVQLQFGPDKLCTVCRSYPKFVSEFGLLQERGLSLSCPEVCRMILTQEAPLTLCTGRDDTPLTGCNEIDAKTFTLLQQARPRAFALAQARGQTLHRRLLRLLYFARSLQRQIGGSDYGARLALDCRSLSVRPAAALRTLQKWCRALQQLEALTPQWRERLDHLENFLRTAAQAPAAWAKSRRKFLAALPPIPQEQILSYYLYKFFLRSAYRGDVLPTMRLIVFFCLMLETLCLAAWERSGQSLTRDDAVEIIHRFAREIEHSEENLALLRRRMCRWHACQDSHLAALLLLP